MTVGVHQFARANRHILALRMFFVVKPDAELTVLDPRHAGRL
jgi:hypothetical protein